MGTARVRNRNSSQSFGGREYAARDPSLLDRKWSCTAYSGQTTWDSKHDWPNGTGPLWDSGGEFTTKIYDYISPGYKVDWRAGNYSDYRYSGDLLPEEVTPYYGGSASTWPMGNGGLTASGELNLVTRGATAVSRCAPANPHASLSVTLGELYRDGLPAMAGLNTFKGGGRPSAVAGEYLNYQFGIKPLVSDLKKLAKSVTESERILSQYYRDSGRVVRRRYAFPMETETRTYRAKTNVVCWPVLMYNFWSQAYGNIDVTVVSKKKQWFSGAFSYYAKPPTGWSDFRGYAQQANHLLGLGLNPAVIYDLTPWSWAADWFTNLGDVMNNVSMVMSDGLVMRYGYIMEHYSNECTVTWKGGVASNGTKPSLTHTFKYEYKRRRAATPFGFGLTGEDFTPRQWAIIAALGLSRGGAYRAETR